MTAIIGYNDGKKIYLASDGICSSDKETNPFANQKIVRLSGYENILVAFTGTRVMFNSLKTVSKLLGPSEDPDYLTMVNVGVPHLFDFFEKHYLLDKDQDGFLKMLGKMIVATPHHLYLVDSYGLVSVITRGFVVCGVGNSVALPYLLATENKGFPLEERLVNAIKVAIHYCPGVGYPIYLGRNDGSPIQKIEQIDTAPFHSVLAKE